MGHLLFWRLRGSSRHCSSLGLGCQLEKSPEASADAPVRTSRTAHPLWTLHVSCLPGSFAKVMGRLENKPKPGSSGMDLIAVEGTFGAPVHRRVLSTINLFCYRYWYFLMFGPTGPGVFEILVLTDRSPRSQKIHQLTALRLQREKSLFLCWVLLWVSVQSCRA